MSACPASGGSAGTDLQESRLPAPQGELHSALFWEALIPEEHGEHTVRCLLCPHRCVINDDSTGRCRVRHNFSGALYALSWGHISALALDPVEKKPLREFHPGSFLLSAGSWGCNLGCRFCQNHSISQTGIPQPGTRERSYETFLTPSQLVAIALDEVPKGNIGIAYTYNEPLVGYEYVLDSAVLARERGLKNVLVTNGFINEGPLSEILPYIDAMNIDLKAFSQGFYRSLCGGSLEPVKAAIARSVSRCHVEVTTLVIPGRNSAPAEIDALSSWLASLSPDIPLHLTRHHPDYRMAEPAPISRDELFALADIARGHLHSVYCGNI